MEQSAGSLIKYKPTEVLSIWKKGNLNFIKTQRLTLAKGSSGSKGGPALCVALASVCRRPASPHPGGRQAADWSPLWAKPKHAPEMAPQKRGNQILEISPSQTEKWAEEDNWETFGEMGILSA